MECALGEYITCKLIFTCIQICLNIFLKSNIIPELGYRHFDTAARYGNEHLLGKALTKWIQNKQQRREELFIVTKVGPTNYLQNLYQFEMDTDAIKITWIFKYI